MSAAPAAAWFPDPNDPAYLRWWDGVQWTDHRHPAAPPVAPVAAAQQQQPSIVVMPAMMGAAPAAAGHGGHANDPALAREHLELQRQQLELQRQQMARSAEREERMDRDGSWHSRLWMFWTGMSLLRMFRGGHH
ncbi:MAG: hypothetical protein JWM86_1549 [Thermoleophilia bacterium]|nr:hypothetical protein [Thermoleophilia bacterium]